MGSNELELSLAEIMSIEWWMGLTKFIGDGAYPYARLACPFGVFSNLYPYRYSYTGRICQAMTGMVDLSLTCHTLCPCSYFSLDKVRRLASDLIHHEEVNRQDDHYMQNS